ncbi:nucleoside recognition domain-containing protein [Paenibacillus favisporus]|uniref:nucleoside recognition domain-containing protein n=1 Tax=Paenibacillus favisporus TaxID=221028 RepID=UPI002DBF0F7A|nr:nucleoside recognition domain-containing protein [Paenibacillus favisporus]MEC0174710.1 nucleoside recognition domain-containing protein [Paenibacillus favisporus]
MKKTTHRPSPKAMTLMLGACAAALVAGIVSSPAPAFQASLQGLNLWWKIVFPGLLPFLVLSEILIAYGWVSALGAFLEPLMKKLFRLPGTGGWVMAMGLTTGFPGGAQAVQQLHAQGSLQAEEAGKLAALSHFCNPVMILVVVATGLMHDPALGYGLIAVHWIAGILAYLTVHRRFRTKGAAPASDKPRQQRLEGKPSPLPARVLQAAEEARAKDGRSFGRLLGDSVTHAVQVLMMIGGYIIIFSVVIQIAGRVTTARLPIPNYALSSLFEVHLGARDISAAAFASGGLQWSVLSALLGFSGFSALLQSMSLIRKTGAPLMPMVWTRILHGAYAFALTWLTWAPLAALLGRIHPVYSESGPFSGSRGPIEDLWVLMPQVLKWQGLLLAFILGALIVLLIVVPHRDKTVRR